jgi:hypothetical protein
MLQQWNKVNQMSRTYRQTKTQDVNQKRRKTKKNKYTWNIFREEQMNLSYTQDSSKDEVYLSSQF